VRDDALPNAQTLRPKLYHLYREPEVADDLNRKAAAHEALPALVQHRLIPCSGPTGGRRRATGRHRGMSRRR
jgi:hypothetical protein